MKKNIPFPDNLIYEMFGNDNIVVNDDMEEALLYALDYIPIVYRDILLLRFRDYKTYKEIACILHTTSNAV